MNAFQKARAAIVALALFFASSFPSCTPVRTVFAADTAPVPAISHPFDAQVALGNPDHATVDPGNKQHYLIQRLQYCVSYNDAQRIPNWVSWHLCKSDIGSVPRDLRFVPDSALPPGFTLVQDSDYDRCGYDRGHMCPSKDRTATVGDNQAVFFLTNIAPQLHTLNAGPWERLEQYCRDQATAGNDLYIVCGSITNSNPKRIGHAQIAVPVACWKVVVIVPRGQAINPVDRVIAVMMPNDSTITLRSDWHQYRLTPADIERATGYRFFDSLPAATAAAFEIRKDTLK